MVRVMDSKSRQVTDPIRNFKFLVNINHQSLGATPAGLHQAETRNGPSMAQLGFMNMSGLSASTDPIPYREGGDNTALPLDAPVLTTAGWKAMADIEIGDKVIDPKGEDSKVSDIIPAGVKDTYRVTLQDGSQAEACFGHRWKFSVRDSNNKRWTQVGTTLDMKEYVERPYYQVLLPKMEPFDFEVGPELPIHPYLLGVLLAEGSFGESVTLGNTDDEIIERINELLPEGHDLVKCSDYPPKYRISVGNAGGAQTARNVSGRNLVLQAIADMGLSWDRAWEKFIPEIYKFASINERVELLRGLMDGDGWVDKNSGAAKFSSSSERLTHDVKDLVLSLGGRCRVDHYANRVYTYKGEIRPCRDKYEINSGFCGMEINPFHLSRKADLYRTSSKRDSWSRQVVSVEYIGKEEVQCISVSASSESFVAYEFMPTLNTQRKMPGQTNFADVTLSRGVVVGTWQSWYWLRELFFTHQGQGINRTPGQNRTEDFRADVEVMVLNHPFTSQNPNALLKFELFNAWPTVLAYSELDAGGNAVFIEQITLTHEGFDMKWAKSLQDDAWAK